MGISPFKTKYQAMAAYKHVKKVELVCIKDGSRRVFLDDGPFPTTPDGKPVDGWQTRTPQSGRSNLLKKMDEREADPLAPADDPDAKINLFVYDGPGPLPKVWDPSRRREVSPERMTDHHRKVMAVFCKQRNEIETRANEAAAAKKAEAEAKNNAGLDALLALAAQRVAQPVAPKAAPAKKAGEP